MATKKKCQIREQYVELKFCCAYSSTMQEHRINKTVQFVINVKSISIRNYNIVEGLMRAITRC